MSLDENAIIREGFGTGKGFTFAGCAPGTLVLPVAQGDPCAPVPPKGGRGGEGNARVVTSKFSLTLTDCRY